MPIFALVFEVKLDAGSVEQLTAPTWFDYTALSVASILALLSLTWLGAYLLASLFGLYRKYFLTLKVAQDLLGTNDVERQYLRNLAHHSLRQGYGQSGIVGQLD